MQHKHYDIIRGSNKIQKDLRRQYNVLQRKKIYLENNMHSDSDKIALEAAQQKRLRKQQRNIALAAKGA